MTILTILTAVLNTLWQAGALAALVWLAMKRVRMNAATRCVIWWVVLTVLVLLPFAPRPTLFWIHPRVIAAGQIHKATPVDRPAPPSMNELPVLVTLPEKPANRWPLGILGIWAAVLIFRLARIGQSYLYLRSVKRNSITSGLRLPDTGRSARVLLSSDIASPMAVGFVHAAVIIPGDLIERITPGELDQILLHESAHLARRDDWWNLLARLLGAVLALHPVAWWILRQIEYEREAACDDWVVARTGAVRPYAETLAHMAELRWQGTASYHAKEALASGVFGRGSRIGNRIDGLLQAGRQFSASVSLISVFSGCILLFGLATAGLFAPRWVAFAQTPAQSLKFEVASVRLSPAGTSGGITMRGGPGTNDPNRVTIERASLESLILIAYDIQTFQVTGPDWLIGNFGPNAVKVDVNATLPPGTTKEQFHIMLQNLLVDRFRLVIRRQKKEMPIYELMLAKNGPKFSPAAPAVSAEEGKTQRAPVDAFSLGLDNAGFPNLPPEGGMRLMGNRGRMHFPRYTMEQLANFLTPQTQRPVTNATGLKGEYDVSMFWGGDEGADGSITLEEAVQDQLGLKLESKKGEADVFVIDHIEKAPTEN